MSAADILAKFGTTTDKAGESVQSAVKDRVLLLDADSICYHAANGRAKLETAQRHATTAIYEALFLTRSETVRIHLTPEGCLKNGRRLLNTVKVYQFSRKQKAKPPLLQELRNSLSEYLKDHRELAVFNHMDIEADDGLMLDSYEFGEHGVVWSEDKDLNLVPNAKYNIKTGIIERINDRFGWIKASETPAGAFKCLGHGTKFFWYQMLAGDGADSVKGILKLKGRLCGDKTACDYLVPVLDESEAANLVIAAYAAIKQNVIAEAQALWLIRFRGDNALKYMWSLNLTTANREYLVACSKLPLYMSEEEYLQRTDPKWSTE